MPLKTITNAAESAGRLFAILAGYSLLGLSLLICAEIVLRRIAGISLQGVDEIGGYVLAGSSAFGFAYALLCRGHTRIDILVSRTPSVVKAVLNILSSAVMALIAAFMAWRAYMALDRSLRLGSLASTPLQTPIWIPQSIWVAGLVFFALVAFLFLVRSLSAAIKGADCVNSVAGITSLDEIVAHEVSSETKKER